LKGEREGTETMREKELRKKAEEKERERRKGQAKAKKNKVTIKKQFRMCWIQEKREISKPTRRKRKKAEEEKPKAKHLFVAKEAKKSIQ
jgi:hypothetical protein